MTRDQKDVLIKDLHARLLYDTCVYVAINTVNGLEWDSKKLTKQLLIEIEEEDAWEYIKPLLRPMSSMTEEEFVEYYHIKYNKVTYRHKWKRIDVGKYHNVGIIPIDEYLDWLNAHHFDYCGLIPMDLAIEVTEENNPYKQHNYDTGTKIDNYNKTITRQ